MSFPEVTLKSFSSFLSSAYEPNWALFEANLPEGYPKDRTLYTPLQVAIICQDVARCRMLLEEGANANEKGSIDVAPLETALEDLNNEEIAILLVEKGAEIPEVLVNFTGAGVKGLVPLWFSLLLKNKGQHFVKSCVENGKIEANTFIQGANILVWANHFPESFKDQEELLTFFIQKGASFFPCVTDPSFMKNFLPSSIEGEFLKSLNVLHMSKGKMFEFFYSQANDEHKGHKDLRGYTVIHQAARIRNEHWMQFILNEDSSKPYLFRQKSNNGTTPLISAKKMNNRHYWPLHTFKQLEVVDGGYSKWVRSNIRLSNIIEYPDPKGEDGDVQYYNCDPDPNGKMLERKNSYFKWVKRTFSEYIKRPYGQLNNSESILEAFESVNERTPEIAFQNFIKYKKPILIATAWSGEKEGHEIALLFWKNLCVKVSTCVLVTNTPKEKKSPTDQSLPHEASSLDSETIEPDFSGIQFNLIGKDVSQSAILESMRKLYNLYNMKSQEAMKYFYQTINEELKLEELLEVTAYQTLGNCPYLAAKYSLLASIIISEVQNNITAQSLDDSYEKNVFRFHRWEEESWEQIASHLDTIVRSEFASSTLKEELYGHFIKACIKRNYFRPLLELISKDNSVVNWKEKETGKSLIRVLYRHNKLKESVFKSLISHQVNLTTKDFEGKSFGDDIRAKRPPKWLAVALNDLGKYIRDLNSQKK